MRSCRVTRVPAAGFVEKERRGKRKEDQQNAIKTKFKHFIYKMLNTIKYNISISLGFHKFMDIQLNGITMEDK